MSGPWTIVWGWRASGATHWRESFTDKRLCWARVREIMRTLDESGEARRVPVLQVWEGTRVTTFRRYAEGSRFARWGRWGAYTMAEEPGDGTGG